MFNLSEYRRKPNLLADYLPWALFVKEGIIEQKNGLIQTTFEFRGPDLASTGPAEMVSFSARINNALRRLGSGWAIFVEAQRAKSNLYPVSEWPDGVSRAIDEERRRAFSISGTQYESRYFLTFVYEPPRRSSAKFLEFLFKDGSENNQRQDELAERLPHFEERVESIVSLLRGAFVYVRQLSSKEALQYLNSTVSRNKSSLAMPDVPVFLDAIIGDSEIHIGTELRMGDRFLKTITIRAFPSATVPAILDELNHLAFEYRWCTRFIALDRVDALAELKKYQKRWYSQRKGFGSLLSETLGAGGSALQNTEAVERAADVDTAIQVQANDYAAFGYYTATITVEGRTREEAEERIGEIERVINGCGFSVIRETFNAFDAWLSSLPGHVYANVRRPLVHTLNLGHMLPASAIWSGPQSNTHLGGPVHAVAKAATTPFRLSLNVGDVGHTLILGPTGAGKSTLLSFLALQWLRYPKARVIIFDKGASSRAATLGVGGAFYPLSLNGEMAFQPLRNCSEPAERSWAVEWLSEILVNEGVEVTAAIRTAIWEALGPQGLGGQPAEQRTLFGFSAFVQDEAVRGAIQHYITGGQYGALFDSSRELWTADVSWVTFEMEKLMESSGAVPAALSYLFHRIELSMTGDPTLLILDEAWLFLDHPIFAEKIREWLKVLRKKNVYVVFATQSVADAMSSSIAPTILESCLTRILLPNSRAMEPENARYYRQLGLSVRQVEILSNAIAKRQYYFQSPRGNRLFELGLGSVALAFCAASDPQAQKDMDYIIAQFGAADFGARWLAKHQAPQWAIAMAGGTATAISSGLEMTIADDMIEKFWEQT